MNQVRDHVNRRIKSSLGYFLFHTGLYRRLCRGRAVIAVFHRVDDRYATDPISCSVSVFQRFCSFFQRFFTVVPLSDLVQRIRRGEPVGGLLCITFDDGYKDNFTVASRELLSRRLPACFFIASDLIGSSRVPWWDAEAGIVSEWMSWDDVRDLHAAGFEVGAHTKNHVDLGVVNGIEAQEEIVESGRRLRTETGSAVTLFSYPYGRRNQITEENRARVRAAGYECCASAYGGTVRFGDDPYRLKRTPVSQWHVSPYQFGLEFLLDND